MPPYLELLQGRNLTRLVTGTKTGIKLSIPPQLLIPTDPNISGNLFEFFRVDNSRDVARIVARDSPSRRIGKDGISKHAITMLDSKESVRFVGNQLLNLINPENEQRQRMGEAEVIRHTRNLKRRLVELKQSCAMMMLFNFAIHFDEDGNLLPSSSGAAVSADAQIPAGQKDQLDILGSGDIISASWATGSTNIIAHIETMKEQMFDLGGWEIKHAYYGKNIPRYIAANDIASEWINRNPQLNAQLFAANQVPDGFQELSWHRADGRWIDQNGTGRAFVGDDEIVFTPDPDETWWRFAQGSNAIAMDLSIAEDATTVLSNIEEVFGDYGFTTMEQNPAALEQHVGSTFIPMITAPRAVCKADVTP